MRFNDIGLKDLVLDFDSNDLQDITIVQGDTKTRGFKVLVSTNNGEIIKASSQYEMRLYGINSNYPDKSFFTKGVIDGDFYKVYISTDMASKSGKLQLQLALFEGKNALIQSRIKEVDVYASIANGGNVGKDLVVDFGKLQDALDIAEKQQKKFDESLVRQEAVESQIAEKHTEVVQIRDGLKDVLTTENARVEAEKKRVSAENTRVSQENTRQQQEDTRKRYEDTRIIQESTRQSNEQQRQAQESTRKSEEQKRITAETNRDSAEAKRNNAEKQRASNEDVRVNAENARKENDATYSKNEQQRQTNEQQRQTQEQQRVEAEKLRQSQEDTRKQSEDIRVSQEKTRLTQEQSRVDAESKREASETTRKESEQTRNTKETERQKAEQTRQSNENTRQQQESSRVEAEKQRAAAESDRAGKFAGWDKTMQGVIPTATSTVAGIVRIDVDGESTAVSKKSFDENVNALYEAYGGTLNDVNTMFTETNVKIDAKADKKHTHLIADVTGLQTTLDKKLEQKDISTLKTQVDTNTKGITEFEQRYNQLNTAFDEELKLKADKVDVDKFKKDVSTSFEQLNNEIVNKADKKHTHSIGDVEGLRNTLDNHERIFNSNIGSISNLSDKLQYKASADSVAELEKKVDGKADKTDLSSLQTKVNKNQIPRLKIGEDTSKVPNDSYYIETDEIELKKYLSEEKIIYIGDRDCVDDGYFSELIDLKGQKMTKKQDDYYITNAVITGSMDLKSQLKENHNNLKTQEKDFSNHLIILGMQENVYYPEILVYFDFIKKVTKSRKIIHVFDPLLKSKVTQESYDENVSVQEMVIDNPDYLVQNTKLLRGGNVLKYKDENGVIH